MGELFYQLLRPTTRYFQRYQPHEFLFENDRTHKPLTTRTIQKTFQERREALGLPEDATIHSLRHSFATHLLQQSMLYTLLMKSSAKTLLELAQNKKYLGADLGLTAVLHTWGQTLSYHPHVHFIVPGGGCVLNLVCSKPVARIFLFQ